MADDGYQPDIILSIARGGGGRACVRARLQEHPPGEWSSTRAWARPPKCRSCRPPVPNAIDFSNKKVLIADDVSDTGKTLKLVHDFCLDTVAPLGRYLREVALAGEVRVRVEAHLNRRRPRPRSPRTAEVTQRMLARSRSGTRADQGGELVSPQHDVL
ncbi:phosphoribosyltransferase family protein [Streptomyces sp. NBC_00322]|uniref:phosphoribosyltransferase family protein n=1 Tax=Streptomyces sp. NBC_00322 TaxID=2975712 RepID=UPI003FA7B9BD